MENTSKYRLLIVDDDPDQRFVIGELLERGGFEVRLAESANDAIKILSTEKMDLIVSDIHMPSIKGLDFANYLSAVRAIIPATVPIVLITASTENMAEDVKESGACGFCLKAEASRKLLPPRSRYRREPEIQADATDPVGLRLEKASAATLFPAFLPSPAFLNKTSLGAVRCGGVPEWLKGTGCKPVGSGLRRFESYPLHSFTLLMDGRGARGVGLSQSLSIPENR